MFCMENHVVVFEFEQTEKMVVVIGIASCITLLLRESLCYNAPI